MNLKQLKDKTIFAFIMLLLCAFSCAAQEPGRIFLALEVTYLKDIPPTYQLANSSVRYERFGRITAFKPENNAQVVRNIFVISQLEGDTVRVNVAVSFASSDSVREQESAGAYLLREGEKVVAEELKKFGVEPFEIAVVNRNPVNLPTPSATSKVPAVQIERVEIYLPSYRVKIKNISEKKIIGMNATVYVGKKKGILFRPRLPEQPPIEPQAIHTFEIAMAKNEDRTLNGYASSYPPNQSVVITAVIFTDHTYEGDVEDAANLRASAIATKTQLIRIINILEAALAEQESKPQAMIESIKSKIAVLGTESNAAMEEELFNEFAVFNQQERKKFRETIELVLRMTRGEMMYEIEGLEQSEKNQPTRELFFKLLLAYTIADCKKVLTHL